MQDALAEFVEFEEFAGFAFGLFHDVSLVRAVGEITLPLLGGPICVVRLSRCNRL